MAIYTYECIRCDRTFELPMSFTAHAEARVGCSECGEEASQIITSAPNVHIPVEHQAAPNDSR